MTQPNRLDGALPPEFSAPVIDRARPVRFKLDTLSVDGFFGDSVLSALLAWGIDRVGTWRGHPITLDAYTAPNIALAGNETRPDLAMPMAMCPALDGVHFVTLAQKTAVAPVAKLVGALRRPISLGLDPGPSLSPPSPWIDLSPATRSEADVVVVGAGVAGLAAALEAAHRNAKVIVIEREAKIGGLSEYFGKAEGEPLPNELLASLAELVRANRFITLMTGTHAFALETGRISALSISVEDGAPRPVRTDIAAKSVILATGGEERLPIFPGNRLPGVALASQSWRLASTYNVWPGKSAHIHTCTNVGYRMALLGSDSGRHINHVSDPRYNPQTRFIEFCKAFGFRLGWGAALAEVGYGDTRGRELTIAHRDTQTGRAGASGYAADRLIVSGGWQPDVSLWMLAGGAVRWYAPTGQLEPAGVLPGVEIAGSAAGFQSLAGCAQSGTASARRLMGDVPEPIVEHLIDEMFETPDGALTTTRPKARGLPPAFASPAGNISLPEPPLKGWRSFITRNTGAGEPLPRTQSQLDVVGKLAAAMLDPDEVTRYCAQRCILPLTLVGQGATPRAPVAAQSDGLPAYLVARYGANQSLWVLAPDHARRFEPGNLVFANTDDKSPLLSVGVIVSTSDGKITVLVGNLGLAPGDALYVRDGMSCSEVRLKNRTSLVNNTWDGPPSYDSAPG